MKHLIDAKTYYGFTRQIELAGSYGQSIGSKLSCKTLAAEMIIVKGAAPKSRYVVLNKHKPILRTMSLNEAVRAYNELD